MAVSLKATWGLKAAAPAAVSPRELGLPGPCWLLQPRRGRELGQKAGFSSLAKSSSKVTK